MAATIKTANENISSVESGTDRVSKIVTGVSQAGIGMGIMLAGLTGLWALASIISAIATNGGPFALARLWWSAVTGM